MQIQTDHIGRPGFELRIGGDQIPFQVMRLEGVLGPDTRDRHMRDVPQLRRQLARGPMRRSVTRCVFRRPGQDARLDPIGYLVVRTPGIASKQPGQPLVRKPFAPAIDVTIATVQLGRNLGPRQSVSQKQNQTRVPRRIGPTVQGPCLPLQFHAFACSQFPRDPP